jgi:hypothetical protein
MRRPTGASLIGYHAPTADVSADRQFGVSSRMWVWLVAVSLALTTIWPLSLIAVAFSSW